MLQEQQLNQLYLIFNFNFMCLRFLRTEKLKIWFSYETVYSVFFKLI